MNREEMIEAIVEEVIDGDDSRKLDLIEDLVGDTLYDRIDTLLCECDDDTVKRLHKKYCIDQEQSGKIQIPQYFEIKHPLFHAIAGESRTVWDEMNGKVLYIDDIVGNYPRWSIGFFDSIEEAKKRAKEMENEGWGIVENNLSEA